jgi:hypothetical protein
MLTRGLALFLLVATASQAWGGVLYECAYDGLLRSACCCPSGHSEHRAPVALEKSCCAVQQVEAAASSLAWRVEDGPGKSSLPASGALPRDFVAALDVPPAFGAISLAAKLPPWRGSSPLFIQLRILLN